MPSLREALEAALVENPDDLAAHMAYADHLHELGDPRGEFIQTQLALENASLPIPERERLAARELELLDAHQRDWLGGLAPVLLNQVGVKQWQRHAGRGNTFRLRRGWIQELKLLRLPLDLVPVLVAHPALRLLEALSIENPEYIGKGEDLRPLGFDEKVQSSSVLYHLTAAPWLTGLRRLRIGKDDRGDGYDGFNCNTFAEGIHQLVARTPRLESLCLFAHGFKTENLFALPTLTNLRELVVFHLHEFAWAALANNPAQAKLETIYIHPGHHNGRRPSPVGLEALQPLLRSPGFRKLRHLTLRISDMGDAGCVALVASGLLDQLQTLDLMHGCIGDDGARALAAAPATARLTRLDLADNQMTEAGVSALRAAGVALACDLDSQHEPDDDEWRYAADME